MDWIDRLEAKYGRHAIDGLVRVVVALNAAVFVLYLVYPDVLKLLYLDRALVMRGEIWRLVTYIFIPSLGNWWLMPDYLWLVFWLMFMWMLGEGLEHAWGSFKLNVFYLAGMIGTTVAAFFFGTSYNNVMLNLSLLFAFATIYPDYQILIFLVIPVRIKWVAWFSFAGVMMTFLGGSFAARMAILVSLANYLLFFGPTIVALVRQRSAITTRRQRFEKDLMPETESLHRCEMCGKTELSDENLDFRVAGDGNEYCVEHLPKAAPAGPV